MGKKRMTSYSKKRSEGCVISIDLNIKCNVQHSCSVISNSY